MKAEISVFLLKTHSHTPVIEMNVITNSVFLCYELCRYASLNLNSKCFRSLPTFNLFKNIP